AALDDVDQAAVLQVGGDEAIGLWGTGAIPAAGPVAGAADDRNNAPRVRAIQPGGVLDPGSHAALSLCVEVPEIVRDLGAEDVAARLERGLRQFGQDLRPEAAGGG